MSKKALLVGVIISITFFMSIDSVAFAHRSGCHRWHSCPSDSGSYSCGDTGYDNYCGYSTYNVYTPKYTNKDVISYLEIPYRTITIDDPTQYEGYRELVTPGSLGRKKITTTIYYTDSTETSRNNTGESIEQKEVNEVYKIGTRKKPIAYVDYVSKEDERNFWDRLFPKYFIAASGKPKTNFALLKNDKVVALGRSDRTGMLNFDNISVKDGDKLAIGTYNGKKFLWWMPSATRSSELFTVNLKDNTVVSEYSVIHNLPDARLSSDENASCSEEVKKSYLEGRDEWEIKTDGFQGEVHMYYPVPCTIYIEKRSAKQS